MVATSLLLWPVADTGWFYPVAAVVLGAVFLRRGPPDVAPRRAAPTTSSVIRPMRLFHWLEHLPLAALRRGRARPAAHALTHACPTGSLAGRKSAGQGNRTVVACVLSGTTVGLSTGVQANRRPRQSVWYAVPVWESAGEQLVGGPDERTTVEQVTARSARCCLPCLDLAPAQAPATALAPAPRTRCRSLGSAGTHDHPPLHREHRTARGGEATGFHGARHR